MPRRDGSIDTPLLNCWTFCLWNTITMQLDAIKHKLGRKVFIWFYESQSYFVCLFETTKVTMFRIFLFPAKLSDVGGIWFQDLAMIWQTPKLASTLIMFRIAISNCKLKKRWFISFMISTIKKSRTSWVTQETEIS